MVDEGCRQPRGSDVSQRGKRNSLFDFPAFPFVAPRAFHFPSSRLSSPVGSDGGGEDPMGCNGAYRRGGWMEHSHEASRQEAQVGRTTPECRELGCSRMKRMRSCRLEQVGELRGVRMEYAKLERANSTRRDWARIRVTVREGGETMKEEIHGVRGARSTCKLSRNTITYGEWERQ